MGFSLFPSVENKGSGKSFRLKSVWWLSDKESLLAFNIRSWSPRMAWVEKDHNDHLFSTPLLCAGSPSMMEIHWCTALADISYRSLLLRSIWTMDVKLFLKSSTTVDYIALTVVLYCFWQQSFPKSLSSVCHCLLEICWEACWNLLILPLMIAGWCVLAMCLSWQIKSCITLQQVSSP